VIRGASILTNRVLGLCRILKSEIFCVERHSACFLFAGVVKVVQWKSHLQQTKDTSEPQKQFVVANSFT